jgi:cardiolipin synthase
MIVDGLWTSVGFTNFDNRSFRLNDEANLILFDKDFAEQETRGFEADKDRAKRITRTEWRNRPVSEESKEHLAALLRAQL